jgi:hypothetical protein
MVTNGSGIHSNQLLVESDCFEAHPVRPQFFSLINDLGRREKTLIRRLASFFGIPAYVSIA